jgi:murein DD-endopeptidase MepM/ murein hydrolase activator NlpD
MMQNSELEQIHAKNAALHISIAKQESKLEELQTNLQDIKAMDLKLQKLVPLEAQGANPANQADDDFLSALSKDSAALQLEDVLSEMEMGDLESEALRQIESLAYLVEYFSERKLIFDRTPSFWPVKGSITSPFGLRPDPYTGLLAMHSGVDIAAPLGTPVVAAAAGVVTHAGVLGPYGNLVIIHHGFGLSTHYGHLSSYFVRAGDEIKAGETIAEVGDTGRTTGPHLHFEIREHQHAIDPRRYILN